MPRLNVKCFCDTCKHFNVKMFTFMQIFASAAVVLEKADGADSMHLSVLMQTTNGNGKPAKFQTSVKIRPPTHQI